MKYGNVLCIALRVDGEFHACLRKTALQPLKCNVVQPHSSTFMHSSTIALSNSNVCVYCIQYTCMYVLIVWRGAQHLITHTRIRNTHIIHSQQMNVFMSQLILSDSAPYCFHFVKYGLIAIFAFDLRLLF